MSESKEEGKQEGNMTEQNHMEKQRKKRVRNKGRMWGKDIEMLAPEECKGVNGTRLDFN